MAVAGLGDASLRPAPLIITGQTRISSRIQSGTNANHKKRRRDAANFNKLIGAMKL
jgi:hypothetical protein